MAESVVSFLVTKLSEWISEMGEFSGGLRENAEYIRDEMARMKAFLKVADQKEEIDPQLKEWVEQVREIAFDAQDLMDKFMLRFAGEQRNEICDCVKKIYFYVKDLKARCEVSSEFLSLQNRVKAVSEGQQRYRDIYGTSSSDSSAHSMSSVWYDSRSDALLLEDTEVVGIEKPKTQLLELILTSKKRFYAPEVISVVGTGGLGKTTLVRKVYEEAMVKARFKSHVWITASNSCKLQELLTILIQRLVAEVKQPSPQELKSMDVDEMKEFIYKFLQHRSYIMVLDDVWRLGVWEAIRYAFPRNGANGCVIITTRFQSIGHAASAESNGHVYNLEPLTPAYASKLFCRKAFKGESCPVHLEEIAGILLEKCEGLPLAIAVISSLLSTKGNNLEEWRKFLGSLGDEIEGDYLQRLTKLLSLSYYDLPFHLKSCFLYLSIFPEDHHILKRRLIRLWVAEGFVQPKHGKSMEEVAEDYVMELLDRGLIQVAEATNYGSPSKIRVHNIFHSIILSKAEDQKFATIASDSGTRCAKKSRRLAIHGTMENMEEIRGNNRLRSLLVLNSAHPLSHQNLFKLLGYSSMMLNVLELRGVLSEKIPDVIFHLYHLKYLSLKDTKVKIIPKAIRKLQNLETLDLRDTRVTELPIEILRLQKLRHLMVYSYKGFRGYRPFHNVHCCKIPYTIGCLSSLQTLTDIEATNAENTTIVMEIGKLTKMKRLGIMKLRKDDGKDLCLSLSKLTRLESLHIAAIDEDEIMYLQYPISLSPSLEMLELRGRLQELPHWITSLHGLTKLYLRWSRMDEDPLHALENLHNLVELELYHAYEGDRLCFKSGAFQKLQKLWLLRLNRLRCVNVEEGAMPLLQKLYVWGCKLMEDLPSGIEHLSHLQYVDFSDMDDEFVSAIRNEKEMEGDKWRLSKVPNVEIYSYTDGEWIGQNL